MVLKGEKDLTPGGIFLMRALRLELHLWQGPVLNRDNLPVPLCLILGAGVGVEGNGTKGSARAKHADAKLALGIQVVSTGHLGMEGE